MLKGWSFNWKNPGKVGRQNSETRWVESLLFVYLCVLSMSRLSLMVAGDNPLAHKGQLPYGPTTLVKPKCNRREIRLRLCFLNGKLRQILLKAFSDLDAEFLKPPGKATIKELP
jgi:hypothetical protein